MKELMTVSRLAGVATILGFTVSVIGIWRVAEEQRIARYYEAWQTISAAHGQTGSGGRIQALEDLNSQHIPLTAVDLSEANIFRVNLRGAQLQWSTFYHTFMQSATLDSAHFTDADFTKANLALASLVHCLGRSVSFRDAALVACDLTNSDLEGADFSHANMEDAVLRGCYLAHCRFTGANLAHAEFHGADVAWSDFTAANLSDVDFGLVDLTQVSLDSSLLCGARLRRACLLPTQLAGVSDWRGAEFPASFGWLELPRNASYAEQNSLRQTISSIAQLPSVVALIDEFDTVPHSPQILLIDVPRLRDFLDRFSQHMDSIRLAEARKE